jgi:hypothetical protein
VPGESGLRADGPAAPELRRPCWRPCCDFINKNLQEWPKFDYICIWLHLYKFLIRQTVEFKVK